MHSWRSSASLVFQGQEVALAQRTTVQSAKAGPRKGRLAPQRRRDVEAAFDRKISDRTAGKRADAQNLAFAQTNALQRLGRADRWKRPDRRRHRRGHCRLQRRPGRSPPRPQAWGPDRRSPAPLCPEHCRPADWQRAGSRRRVRPTQVSRDADTPAVRGPAAWSSGRAPPPSAQASCNRPPTMPFRFQPELACGRPGQQCLIVSERHGLEYHFVAGAEHGGRVAAQVPERKRAFAR